MLYGVNDSQDCVLAAMFLGGLLAMAIWTIAAIARYVNTHSAVEAPRFTVIVRDMEQRTPSNVIPFQLQSTLSNNYVNRG